MIKFPDSSRDDIQAVCISTENYITWATGATRSEVHSGEVIPMGDQLYQVIKKPKLKPMQGGWFSFKAVVREVSGR